MINSPEAALRSIESVPRSPDAKLQLSIHINGH